MKQSKRMLAILLAVLMLALMVPVTASATPTYQVGDLIQFGSYPQTLVTDEETITKLDAATKTWKSYGYFTGTGNGYDGKMEASDYMEFADFFCDGIKYRAVRFSLFRPWSVDVSASTDTLRTKQPLNGFNLYDEYYFQYEPLVWRVLDSLTGYVVCESIVDAQAYQNIIVAQNREYWHDETEAVYASDYENSTIREWLNNEFLETAFTTAQKDKIKTTTLNNDAGGVYPSTAFNSAITRDKIFLMSYSDILNPSYGFDLSNGNDYNRIAKGTDYAKCQGLDVLATNPNGAQEDFIGNSCWWLRSALHSLTVCTVNTCGGSYDTYSVSNTCGGVRPACKLSSLQDDTTVSDTLMSSIACLHEEINNHERLDPTCISWGREAYTSCRKCGVVISGSKNRIEKTDHSTTTSFEVEKEATCSSEGFGIEYSYCSVCGHEFGSTFKIIPKIDHTPGEAVRENDVAATCTEGGSYDSVVYCTKCGEKLRTETVITSALDHTAPDANGNCTRCGTHIKDVTPTQPDDGGSNNGNSGKKLNIFQIIIQWIKNLFKRIFGR